MKRYIILINLIFLVVLKGFSQVNAGNATPDVNDEEDAVSTTDPVEIKKSRFGTTFYQKGEKVSASLLQEVVVNSPEAVREIKLSRKNYLPSVAFNTVGGLLVGYSVGAALLGGNVSWPWAGVGAGLLAIGIPFTKAYVRHAENAATIHNKSLDQGSLKKSDFQFGMNAAGIGFKLTF